MSKVAFLVAAEGIERVELTEPWKAVQEAGHEPVLLSPDDGEVQTFNHLTAAEKLPVDKKVADVAVEDFGALVLPGGVANPDALRTDEKAVAFGEGLRRLGQTGRRDLSRSVDADRGRRRPGSHGDILAESADGPAERGGDLGRPGSGRRREF